MTPLQVLRAFSIRGGAVYPTPDGALELEGPDAAVDEFLPLVREHKPALLALLAAPRKAAYQAWESAMGEISSMWEVHERQTRAAGREPLWRDDEADTAAVKAAILATTDAETLATALQVIETWRSEWARLVAEGDRPPCQGELPLGSGAAGPPEPSGETARAYRTRKRRAPDPEAIP